MSFSFPDGLMVSVSGFRGRVGDPLTPELVARLAAGFGAFLGAEGRGDVVCVGRDSRTSGPMLERAAVAGLQSVGCEVVRLGLVPTPTLLLAVEHHGAAGAVGVTASHNPAEWNALKLASDDGMFLDAETSSRFQNALLEAEPNRVAWDELRPGRVDTEAVDRHVDAVLQLSQVDVGALKDREFHVALDCVHGAGGRMMPELLRALGCRLSVMGGRPDGIFPRDPEPRAENLGDLGGLITKSGAELGLAVDPDADRLALVDESGRPPGEDFTLALASAAVLSRTPGTVVTNLSTSRVVEDAARLHGGEVVRAPVGEINVARAMQQEAAVVGGEGNGGVILPELHYTRDAFVGAALILQHLLDTGGSLSEAVAELPSYVIVKEKVSFPRAAVTDAYGAIEEDLAAPERDTTDGLRLSWPKRGAWLHVRPSGTEPVVRLIAEALEAGEARALVERGRAILEGVL